MSHDTSVEDAIKPCKHSYRRREDKQGDWCPLGGGNCHPWEVCLHSQEPSHVKETVRDPG